MILAILGFSLVGILIAAGAIRSGSWKSSMHIVNANWLEDPAKFRLLARWGITR